MEAQVLSVEVGKEFVSAAGKTYNALSLITQGKPYRGDSRYKNMESFEIIGADAGIDQGSQKASTTFAKDLSGTNQSASIARAVALKASVECTTAMLNKDMFKKTAKPDFIANEILALANYFEKYLTFSEETTVDFTDELLDTDDDLT